MPLNVEGITIVPMCGYADDAVDDLAQEMEKRFGNVKVIRDVCGKAGANEIFFAILAVLAAPGAIYAKSFLETLGSEHAKALNEKILAALKGGDGQKTPNGMYSLLIAVEEFRFYFRKANTGEVMRERLQAASSLVDSLPEASADHPKNGRGFYWDPAVSTWQPVPRGWAGDICPPDAE